MNDFVIKMLASQLSISPAVLEQLKQARPRMIEASVSDNGEIVTLTVEVSEPGGAFPVIITLPMSQLHRVPPIYEKVMQLAYYRTPN